MNTREPESDWQSASESWIGIMDGSGSNPNRDKDQLSSSRSLSDSTSAGVSYRVLIVEDNESDVYVIREAMEATRLPCTLEIVEDGEQAVRFFDRADDDAEMPCPALVILDINLPKKQGGDVLRHMRQSRRCASIPVIAVSTSDSAQDRERMTNLGVDRYFKKPSDYDEFMKLGQIAKALLEGAASFGKSMGRT